MGIRLGTHGRVEARGPVPGLLMVLLLAAVAGCGTRQSAQAPADSQSGGGSSPGATVVASTQNPVTHHPGGAGPINRITISNRRCIQFEPQWTSVHVGQSLTWRSE